MQPGWPPFPPGPYPIPLDSFAGAVARLLGRRLRVVTVCEVVIGRLVFVGSDFLRVRRGRRTVLIPFRLICLVELKRSRHGFRPC
ncbi:MAG: hypothetical protein ACM3ZA_01120 [Bacillota bacterium]